MLNKKDLLKKVDEKYAGMIKDVNIVDFTKCIAQFSGLHISKVSDKAIEEYLTIWAGNKYRFYKMLGNKLKKDIPVEYKEENKTIEAEMRTLEKEYPSFALWLEAFKDHENNKIDMRYLDIDIKRVIRELFPNHDLCGCSITHFFKSYINAPNDLVTKIGKIWENEVIKANYTISIDPVDMMFASENPYNWTSCYRLEAGNDCSHADGCLAAILDDSSLITYVWNKEGSFSLYSNYDFKKIRYYRMREWISISPEQTAIHFNAIYPGKRYSLALEKMFRNIVENVVDETAIWEKSNCSYCSRYSFYGYDEFNSSRIYKIKDTEERDWNVYTEDIVCPCGCGNILPGADYDEDDSEGYSYSGGGFIYDNFSYNENYWDEDEDEEDCDVTEF